MNIVFYILGGVIGTLVSIWTYHLCKRTVQGYIDTKVVEELNRQDEEAWRETIEAVNDWKHSWTEKVKTAQHPVEIGPWRH